MDALDKKILYDLLKNSRVSVTELARKVRSSREVVNYRLNRLIKEKIIIEFVSEIDTDKLGYVGAAVFLSLRTSAEKEFLEYIKQCGYISWVGEHSGIWTYLLSIYAKNNDELDKKFQEVYKRFKKEILDHRFVLHKDTQFFHEKYLGKSSVTKKKKSIPCRIDDKDKTILRELSNDSRKDVVQLAKKVNLTAPATATRVKRLVNSGMIKRFSAFLDVQKLGLYQYSVFITNKNDQERLLGYLKEHPNVSFTATYVGNPFMEFGVVVEDPYQLRRILQEIEESFPDNRIKEVSLFQKEFLSAGPPKCCFE